MELFYRSRNSETCGLDIAGSFLLCRCAEPAPSAADESLYTLRFSARVSRGGLRFDAFICVLIGSFLSLLSVTSQARKAEMDQSGTLASNSRPDKEQLAARARARLPFLKASEGDDPSFERMSRVTR